MPATYRLEIVTQHGVSFDGHVESLRAPGAEGSFGVRPGHAPMIAELTIGAILVRDAARAERVFACSGGILEVSPTGVVVLADAIEESAEIDVERARQAEERARDRLRQRSSPDIDTLRAEIALARALNRLRTARRGL